MKLTPHLHQIGSDIVNAYIVEEARELTIVDAGLPGQWRELLDELSRMGRAIDDVRAILLTHGDTDHIGFAPGSTTNGASPSTFTRSTWRAPAARSGSRWAAGGR